MDRSELLLREDYLKLSLFLIWSSNICIFSLRNFSAIKLRGFDILGCTT